MEKILKQILEKLDVVDTKLERLERLEKLEPLVEESHQWIRTLVERTEVHSAEMDSMKHDLSRVEGVLTGFDKSLEGLKKAQ